MNPSPSAIKSSIISNLPSGLEPLEFARIRLRKGREKILSASCRALNTPISLSANRKCPFTESCPVGRSPKIGAGGDPRAWPTRWAPFSIAIGVMLIALPAASQAESGRGVYSAENPSQHQEHGKAANAIHVRRCPFKRISSIRSEQQLNEGHAHKISLVD
jgi:hypothetical protein